MLPTFIAVALGRLETEVVFVNSSYFLISSIHVHVCWHNQIKPLSSTHTKQSEGDGFSAATAASWAYNLSSYLEKDPAKQKWFLRRFAHK